jgi:tetraacyldisaccharide 4'-kinase
MMALQQAWYRKNSWTVLLSPIAWLFQALALTRRYILQSRYQQKHYPVPVIVIGNIAVGGTGKTPLVIALAKQLSERGVRPGIVSRGYGGNVGSEPQRVSANSSVEQCGDEAVLMARQIDCPVVVCPDRVAAIHHLLAEKDVDVILSDDGLQHYKMHRDMELVVIDGQRGLGNGKCLPAGPLRESARRLSGVDYIVVNGSHDDLEIPNGESAIQMKLKARTIINLSTADETDVSQWCHGQFVHAVAGIGNPERFRDTLTTLGLRPQLHRFPDHHRFVEGDLDFDDDWPIIMTAKDAVKCELLAGPNCWFLAVEAEVPSDLAGYIIDETH